MKQAFTLSLSLLILVSGFSQAKKTTTAKPTTNKTVAAPTKKTITTVEKPTVNDGKSRLFGNADENAQPEGYVQGGKSMGKRILH